MNNGKLIVLLDIDGTTAKFHPAWFGSYTRLSGESFTEAMATQWDVFSLCSHPDLMEKALHTRGLYRNLELFPGVLPALRDLQDICEFWVVSATPDYARKERNAWVKAVLGGMVTKVIYTAEKDKISADVRFDDNQDWIASGDGLRVLMDQPWNRKAKRDQFDVRVSSWGHFHRTMRDFHRERLAACA